METASDLRAKAEQCRRMAAHILTRNDATAASLQALAIEFDAEAAVIDARTAAARPFQPEAAPAKPQKK